jgi:hypothetical protein
MIGTDKDGAERFNAIRAKFTKNIKLLTKNGFIIGDQSIFKMVDRIYTDNVEYERKRVEEEIKQETGDMFGSSIPAK